ncbi:hypothetical protein FRB98_006410 [Tulasnella sp. 332]|nr:hypothetical protein FRB98_006410 [Tulasnella sp. 332]
MIDGGMCLGLWWVDHIVRVSAWSSADNTHQIIEADVLATYRDFVAGCIPVDGRGGLKAKRALGSATTLLPTIWFFTASLGTEAHDSRIWVLDTMLKAMAVCVEYVPKPGDLIRTLILRHITQAFEKRQYAAAAAKPGVVLEECMPQISHPPSPRYAGERSLDTLEREAAAIKRVRASIGSCIRIRDTSQEIW